MAQVKNEPDWVLENIRKKTKEECRFCKGKSNLNILWDEATKENPDFVFYICKDCYHVIRGLYIDILIEKEETENVPIKQQLEQLESRIINLKEIRKRNRLNNSF